MKNTDEPVQHTRPSGREMAHAGKTPNLLGARRGRVLVVPQVVDCRQHVHQRHIQRALCRRRRRGFGGDDAAGHCHDPLHVRPARARRRSRTPHRGIQKEKTGQPRGVGGQAPQTGSRQSKKDKSTRWGGEGGGQQHAGWGEGDRLQRAARCGPGSGGNHVGGTAQQVSNVEGSNWTGTAAPRPRAGTPDVYHSAFADLHVMGVTPSWVAQTFVLLDPDDTLT